MGQLCSRCHRANPPEASFCYYDGSVLAGHARGGPVAVGAQRFHSPFVFPSGRACATFDELALACQQNWSETKELLQQGYLEAFLGGLGRADLALAAREAARFPERDRGLDHFLGKLPSGVLEPPCLAVEPPEVNFGQLRIGDNRRFELHLHNQGMRLLYGSVSCEDCVWLVLGEGAGLTEKLFQCENDLVIPVQLRGERLRAGNKPLEGRLEVESNGGKASVVVRVEVPVTPFTEGVLAGARSPRQIAEKAKAYPKEAAVFLENSAVARWYQANGWTYPVKVPPASGLGAVQQLFEALGLTPPPPVEISQSSVVFQGNAGERLAQTLEVKTQEKKPVWAHATSNQPWLDVGRAKLDGRTAVIPLVIPAVPHRRGETLQAEVTVIANGNCKFVVPVTLDVGGIRQKPAVVSEVIELEPLAAPVPTALTANIPMGRPADAPLPVATLVTPAARRPAKPLPGWTAWLPAGLLALALLVLVVRDVFVKARTGEKEPEIDRRPRIALRFHDANLGGEFDKMLPDPTMRFGLVTLKLKEPGKTHKQLTFDEYGRSNNTCLRVDDDEVLFGSKPGEWVERATTRWKDEHGKEHEGMKSVWLWKAKKVQVTQLLEIVPGEQTDLLDTCLVRYLIENQDKVPHQVDIRFLLDTFIGSNDGVPFTIPGQSGLVDTSADFDKPDKVPEFIQALEKGTLKNPGTVAHLKLKLGGGKEPPTRVTLGAWPDHPLKDVNAAVDGPNTLWNVPVLSMKTIKTLDPEYDPDSAVVIYWVSDKKLAPGEKREVGFAYGLGSVSSSEKLLLTIDGSFKPGGELTVTALVNNPTAGETLTLVVPDGFKVQGTAEQTVPELPAGVASGNRPVTWKVRAGDAGRHSFMVRSSTGPSQSKTVTIKSSSIFD